MKIDSILKKRGLYVVSFEEGEELTVSEELLFALGWKKGREVSLDERFLENLEQDKYQQCFHMALRKLDYGALSSKQLEQRLKKEGFCDKHISFVTEKLKTMKLIDDSLLSKHIIESCLSKRFSKEKIKMKLYSKGLYDEEEDLLSQYVPQDREEDNAYIVAKKKYRSLSKLPPIEIKKKLYSTLSYQGFRYDSVKTAVERVLCEENFDITDE
ncbi:MAG: RecX family transcriptional regulator [Filifactor alocis]|nr:RecX family transcriptional regulator [Filifactor alocis]